MLFGNAGLAFVGRTKKSRGDLGAQPFGGNDRIDDQLTSELVDVDVGAVFVPKALDVRLAIGTFGHFLNRTYDTSVLAG